MKKFILTIWADIKEIKSGKKELREFGFVMGGFFGIIAGLLFWKGKNFLPMLAPAIFFAMFGAFKPEFLKLFQKVWMAIAVIIGFFMTRVILGILFFFILTPISLISRMTGKKYLDLEFRTGADSYWKPRTEELPKERYEKQY